jgi:hypothetical protein
MSSATYVERARLWTRVLEDREAARIGEPVKEARPRVARRVGVASGTLENLRNGRLKAVAVHVYERLRLAVERELTAEMQALEHELQLLRQSGVDPRAAEVEEVVSYLAKARRALGMEQPS